MIETVALVFALITFGVCIVLLQQLAIRIRSLEARIEGGDGRPVFAAVETTRHLQGLRFALAITQDHAHPVFATLLKEQLLKEDAIEVTLLTGEPDWSKVDILISGKLTCNGYAEIYYDADFSCLNASEPICTLIERPPHGDRPSNLAIELVARLKTELEKLLTRTERREALRELRGG